MHAPSFRAETGSTRRVLTASRWTFGAYRQLVLPFVFFFPRAILVLLLLRTRVQGLLRHSWAYCVQRELWKGRKPKGPLMSTMPLIKGTYRDYSRSLAIIAKFIETTRIAVAAAINNDVFSHELIEATCMCKFVGTGFAVDSVSAIRKLMGSRAMQADSLLGEGSFVCNATCKSWLGFFPPPLFFWRC